MTFFNYHFYSIISEIYLLWIICILLLFGVFITNSTKFGFPLIFNSFFFFILISLFFSIILLLFQCPIYFISWNNFLISDIFTNTFKLLIFIICIFWFLISFFYTKFEKINQFEYFILILLSIISIFFILQSYDLLTVYISIEFQSLIFYVLASFNRNVEFSIEAGLKYFILGAFASSFLLLGISILYNLTGLTHFNDYYKFFNYELIENIIFVNEIYFSLVLILCSILFKLSAAPFHFWTPDVYEGSSSSTTFFFLTIPKLSFLSLLIRLIYFTFTDINFILYYIFIFSIVMCGLIGSLNALTQLKWKKFITYSSINHLSFFLVTFILVNGESLNGNLIYLIVYWSMSFILFSFFVSFRELKYPYYNQIRSLIYLKGFNLINPVLSLSILICFFSMAGIPPLAGFFSKFFVLFSLIKSSNFIICYSLLLFTCVSCYYYLKIIKFIYFDLFYFKNYKIFTPLTRSVSLIININLFFLSFFILDLNFINDFINLLSFSFIFY